MKVVPLVVDPVVEVAVAVEEVAEAVVVPQTDDKRLNRNNCLCSLVLPYK